MLQKTKLAIESIIKPKAGYKEDLFDSSFEKTYSTHTCYYEKQGDALEFPLVIIPQKDDFEAFYADLSTFHPSVTPVSAYAYVCTEITASKLALESKKSQRRVKFNDIKGRLDIAMILGEAITETLLTRQNLITANIGYAACTQTLSFSLLKAKKIYGEIDNGEFFERWALAQKLTQHDTKNSSRIAIIHLDELEKSVENENELWTLLKYARGEAPEILLKEFFIEKFGLKELDQEITHTYNGRISAFNKITETVNSSDALKNLKSAAIAYYCNRIQPGSMNHTAVLKNHITEHNRIVFWYMLFACRSEEFEPKNAMSGICLKLTRDLHKPFSISERPECDISVEELEIISRLALKASILKPKRQRVISVSLLPGIDIDLEIGAQDQTSKIKSSDAERDSAENKKLRSILYEALDILSRSSEEKNRKSEMYNSKKRSFE